MVSILDIESTYTEEEETHGICPLSPYLIAQKLPVGHDCPYAQNMITTVVVTATLHTSDLVCHSGTSWPSNFSLIYFYPLLPSLVK